MIRHTTSHICVFTYTVSLCLEFQVMRDFKSHLAINLLPIAPDICTHVISDRQWLQENLLCLMSNAVKYSSKGKRTVALLVSKIRSLLPLLLCVSLLFFFYFQALLRFASRWSSFRS